MSDAAPGPDPGSFGGHPYTPDEIALGYGTDRDPRFVKPDAAPVVLVGTPRSETSDAADRLLDGITVALQEFDTETLLAIADYRDSIHKDGWMQRLVREYVEVWR